MRVIITKIISATRNGLKNLWDLSLFSYTDYTVLIIVIIMCLGLGLFKIFSYFKTNSYLLEVLLLLDVLFLGYLFLMNEEQKVENLRFEYPIINTIGLLGILIDIRIQEMATIYIYEMEKIVKNKEKCY